MHINKEFKVGLLATTAMLVIYLGFNFLKGKSLFDKSSIYYALYSNVQGITSSSKVMLNGCPVGMVKSIEIIPDGNYTVLVALSISKAIKLTDQASAKLVSNNLLGNKVIELSLKEGKPLYPKDTLQTQVEQDFQALFRASTLPTLQDAKAISELTNQFMQTLVSNTDRINNIFASLETAAKQMREAISLNQKDIGTISKNITEITQALADPQEGIRPLLSSMHELSHDIGNMKLQDLATSMGRILTNLEDGPLQGNLNQALKSLDDLLIDFRQQPNKYVHFSIFGRRPNLSLKKQKQ